MGASRQATPMLDQYVDSPMAWRGDTLEESDWRVSMPPACLEEIQQTLADAVAGPR